MEERDILDLRSAATKEVADAVKRTGITLNLAVMADVSDTCTGTRFTQHNGQTYQWCCFRGLDHLTNSCKYKEFAGFGDTGGSIVRCTKVCTGEKRLQYHAPFVVRGDL